MATLTEACRRISGSCCAGSHKTGCRAHEMPKPWNGKRTLICEHDVDGEQRRGAEGHAALARAELHRPAPGLQDRKHAALALVPGAAGRIVSNTC